MKAANRLLLGVLALVAPAPTSPAQPSGSTDELRHPQEVHLGNVRQLTFGGENAEAYWSADGKRLILQSTRGDLGCDQIFIMDADGSDLRMVSTGKGRTTCAYFFPDGKHILYASTHLGSPECPAPPDYSKGYVWKLYPTFEIFSADPDGSDLVRLTSHDGYDAEATMSPDGSRIIFTSHREGDLDLYTMRPDGSDLRRLTTELGYDGGAFFSPDGKKIVWRASRPRSEDEVAAYRALLEENSIRPRALEIFVANADGSGARQVTDNGAANFCPYFFPDGERIIFASNMADPKGRNFDLWMVRTDGSDLERVTFDPTFDAFPMFSPDGRHLVFASNRNAKQRGETNIFMAEWLDAPRSVRH
ncbi:MAG: TolB family protein [Candidatus Krumholzibacteriia bacterium]